MSHFDRYRADWSEPAMECPMPLAVTYRQGRSGGRLFRASPRVATRSAPRRAWAERHSERVSERRSGGDETVLAGGGWLVCPSPGRRPGPCSPLVLFLAGGHGATVPPLTRCGGCRQSRARVRRLKAAARSIHSAWTAANPRSKKRRAPCCSLRMPNTGSINALR
jgi:hypothetical protein